MAAIVWGFDRLARTAVPALAVVLAASAACAQGILTVTPTRTTTTTVGTGSAGYSGDTGVATAATVALPSAVAFDKRGNLYIADTNNHVIREVSTGGTITTIAGTGIEGYSGDGGAATSAQLDTPTGVAVDANGNLYIADSHNQRVREVSNGTITTLAGNGTKGYLGDGAAAASAELALPTGVAVDASGNVYIADTNNNRIREVSGGNISTIAGDGEELFAGDGGAATAAALDSPTGVAVDANGNVYIADRLNQRVRVFTVGGKISTVAGSGSASFAGGFSGDGASATAATLARPTGVSVDSAGNVYVSDTDNQRIRQLVNGGVIVTVVGSGAQGFGGDGGASTSAVLNTPKSAAPDALGNLAVADTTDQRVRSGTLPSLSFGSAAVGVPSALQSVTLANSGSAAITVSTLSFAGTVATAAGGSCPAAPIPLTAGSSCTQFLEFLPTAVGSDTGSLVFSGTGVVPQSVLFTGSAVQATTKTNLSASLTVAVAAQSVTFTANVVPAGLGAPTGTVTFYDGASVVAANVALSGTSASYMTAALADGGHSITAVYSGDTNFLGSTSGAVAEQIQDFQLTLTLGLGSGSGTGSGAGSGSGSGSSVFTIIPGQPGTVSFVLQSQTGNFPYPITLTASGLPAGSTYTFSPNPVTLVGTAPVTVTMTILTPATAWLHGPGSFGGMTAVLALMLLPFSRRFRRQARRLRTAAAACVFFLVLAGVASLTGCGSGSGLFSQASVTVPVTVTGTATGPNGQVIQSSATIPVNVQ